MEAKFASSGANFLVDFAISMNIIGFTNILDKSFQTVVDFTRGLQEALVVTDTQQEKEEILNIIRDLDRTGPFTGLGYFNITKGTLTSMTSVGFTYLIILVQFRQSWTQTFACTTLSSFILNISVFIVQFMLKEEH